MTDSNVTRRLCEFAEGLKFGSLPQANNKRMKAAILDTLGCIILGSTTKAGRIVIDFVRQLREVHESTVAATSVKTSAPYAALANGTMGHEFDYDDGVSTALGIHPGITIIPAALAVGEREQVSGKDLITALTAGYEFACRIGRAIERAPRCTPVLGGVFGATIAASKLLRSGLEEMVNAVGICGSLVPTRPFEPALGGGMVKDMWGGWSNFFGVMCATLAAKGFAGQTDILEAKAGFYATISGGVYDKHSLFDDLGKEFFWMDGHYFKPYSACRGTHVAADAVFKITKSQKIDPDEVDEILVIGPPIVHEMRGLFTPVSARFSIPYVLSTAIVYGKLSPDAFSQDRLKDKTVAELSKKVRTFVDPNIPDWPHGHGPVEVIVKLRNNKELRARSQEERSLTDEEVVVKFKDNASKILTREQVREIADTVAKLEEVRDIGTVASLFASRGK